MKKKVLAAFLSVAMISSLLVGCGSTAAETAAPAATEEAAPAEEEAPAEEAAEETEEEAPAEEAATDSDVPAPAKSSDYDASADPAIDLIFTANASSSDWHGKAMTEFAYAVEELSGGSVTCSVYADSTLYSSENEWDAITTGQAAGGADMAYISFQTLSTQPGLEWCEMIGSAYFWSSYDHMNNTLNGEIGQEIYDRISSTVNVTPINAFYLGSRVINTTNKEINSYDDMKGLLLRMPSSEAWLNLGRALNAEPTSMAFSELYTALQTGAIEGQDNPLPSDIANGFYEVAPYFAITNHVVDSILPCMCTTTWNSLTEAQQLAVKDAFAYARDWNNYYRLDEEASDIDTLVNEYGCTVTYPSVDEFKAGAKAWYDEHTDVTANWDMDLYDKIQANN